MQFLKAIDTVRHPTPEDSPSADDAKLLTAVDKAKADLDAALLDSFDTPTAMQAISNLITQFNAASSVSDAPVLLAARWITRIVTIFGLDSTNDLADANRVGWSGLDIPAAAHAYIYPTSKLRDSVRQAARSGTLDHGAIAKLADETKPDGSGPADTAAAKPYEAVFNQFRTAVKSLADAQAPGKDFLDLADKLRNVQLWDLDIYLEDRQSQHAMVRPVDRALKAERAQREATAAKKAAEKAKRDAEAAEKKRAQDEKAKVSHLEMFKTAEYSEWDENGMPVKDAKGEEVTKSKTKKLVKDWERQKKLHEEYIKEHKA
jgi:cysteinyl-tRNA synthetase